MSAADIKREWIQYPNQPWPSNLSTEALQVLLERLDAATDVIEDLPIEDRARRGHQLFEAAKAVRAVLQQRKARQAVREAVIALRKTGCPSVRGGTS